MPAGIYIHVPFCMAKCQYCDFYSIVGNETTVDGFAGALLSEIEILGRSKWKERVYNTIYFGGGTPPLLGDKNISRVLQSIRGRFNISPRSEIAMEINPETSSPEFFQALREFGLNRLSIGVQSFDNDQLQILGRIHSVNSAVEAIDNAFAAGFENISLDLIFGIPGQSIESWRATLDQAIAKNPTHISAYGLTIEKGTPYHKMVDSGELALVDDDNQAEMYSATNEMLSSAGYKRYEVSNFAKPGFECRHNFKYWRDDKYVGLGPSAHSYDGEKRTANQKNLDKYIANLGKGKLPISFRETLTDKQRAEEWLLLGLRLAEGIDYNLAKEVINDQVKTDFIKQGYLRKKLNKIALTDKGFLMADEIIVKLLKS
ncbi:MAG: radical SAM family heme chaperone HemW [candidate division Zixibacteria bacterium]|nr:radical SAM family heme chaperone HemW [candidate division Zixibacteria bacterium]